MLMKLLSASNGPNGQNVIVDSRKIAYVNVEKIYFFFFAMGIYFEQSDAFNYVMPDSGYTINDD